MNKYKITCKDNPDIFFSAFLPNAIKIVRMIRKGCECELHKFTDSELWEKVDFSVADKADS